MNRLIFGCGYLGRRVASRWEAAEGMLHIVTRSPSRAAALATDRVRPVVADVLRPETLRDLPTADTVLYAVGYDRTAGHSLHEVYVQGLANVLSALPAGTGRIVYVSSTGVYGQTDGESVDEASPCHPTREGGRACLDAERLLSAHELGRRAVILRLAGLYGPGRIPSRETLARSGPLAVPAEGWLNLIHVDDAARVVLAAERQAPLPSLYAVSDGQPIQRRAYYEELARLLGAAQPLFAPPAAELPATHRASSDKRIDNRRMLAELEVRLAYPSYREGLAMIVAGEPGESCAGRH